MPPNIICQQSGLSRKLFGWLGPHEGADWPGKFELIPLVYCEIVRHIARGQRVKLLVNSQAMQDSALETLENAGCNLGNVSFYIIATNRVWVRDSGPIFAKSNNGEQVLLDWKFNAWAKYDDWQLDNQVPEHIARINNYRRVQPEYKWQASSSGRRFD